ncbi:MAG: tetratricopeptide repeat protein [Pseudomonadota bacterium]|nr:tetratricopeptide repeat protein [Pseudomonadota bacterium]
MVEEYLTDDEQVEHVKRVVAENWVWALGGVILGAAVIFGYRYYDGYRNAEALRAAAQFGDMTAALEHDDRNKARQIAAQIVKDHPRSPYADQSQMVMARLAVEEGQAESAIAPLTRVMSDSKDTELRHIARLRLARLLIDQHKPDEAIKTLAEDAPGAFAARYHEVRGDAFYAKNDLKSAATEYQAALAGDADGTDSAAVVQLKIADLGVAAAPASAMVLGGTGTSGTAAPTSSPADSSNKVKP